MSPEEREQLITLGFENAFAGEHGAALSIYAKIISAHPDYATAHYFAGQLLLTNGLFEQGWAECEWRPIAAMPPTIKRWQGEDLHDYPEPPVLLVAGEQGIGDNINFVRYVSLLKDSGAFIVVGTLTGLGRLISTVPGVNLVVEQGGPLPRITHYVPMLSLPFLFKTTLDTIPASVPYMEADPVKVEKWRDRLSVFEGPKVGLVWAGNPDFMGDHRRSPGFDPFREVLKVPGINFFSLQKGAGSLALNGEVLPNNLFDLGPELESLDDTAGAMMNLDLVISSCTSPVHLAGALGRPIWVVLSHFADWRWFRHVETSPWYPTARLFRQKPGEGWNAVLSRVAEALYQARQ